MEASIIGGVEGFEIPFPGPNGPLEGPSARWLLRRKMTLTGPLSVVNTTRQKDEKKCRK